LAVTIDRQYIGRQFDQVCFVVDDLEQAVRFWRETSGVQNWAMAIDLAKFQTEKEIWGRPGNFQYSCAYGLAGNTIIELARYDGGGECVYANRPAGPHHIGFRMKDREEYDRAVADYEESGFERAMGAYFQTPDGTGACRWVYFDTRKQLGCFTELYYLEGSAVEGMERMLKGEQVQLL
jgi:catechol 2,3-dioxygenase-like lactoylglutathione lyase family enzyme